QERSYERALWKGGLGSCELSHQAADDALVDAVLEGFGHRLARSKPNPDEAVAKSHPPIGGPGRGGSMVVEQLQQLAERDRCIVFGRWSADGTLPGEHTGGPRYPTGQIGGRDELAPRGEGCERFEVGVAHSENARVVGMRLERVA